MKNEVPVNRFWRALAEVVDSPVNATAARASIFIAYKFTAPIFMSLIFISSTS